MLHCSVALGFFCQSATLKTVLPGKLCKIDRIGRCIFQWSVQLLTVPRRFSGIARLYGEDGLHRFQQSKVCIIGVGGVGSWAAEALVRSGIGSLVLIDLDHVAESNINRQLQALDDTLGKAKVVALKERFLQINPDCKITCIEEFVSVENVAELVSTDFDFVLDCIDSHRIKAAVISRCRNNKIKIVTAGGAGGQIDPSQVKVSDLRQTEHDPLLAKTRRLLRKQYGFSSNPKRRFGVAAVWSTEAIAVGDAANASTGGGLNCAGLGSAMPVTANFGLLAASHVLKQLNGASQRDK